MQFTKCKPSKLVLPMLAVTLVGNLASCGTIMYPERHGQKAGQIDPLVAVLDGVGLLFFVIPGVIAFAVDFNNHSIYLPHGHTSSIGASHGYSRIQISGKLDKAAIESVIRAETGAAIDLRRSDLQMTRVDSVAKLDPLFAMHEGYVRVASVR
jgi:hypothetical protein